MKVTMNQPLGFGDKLGLVAMMVWITVAVGPWWIGVSLFVGITVINSLTKKGA